MILFPTTNRTIMIFLNQSISDLGWSFLYIRLTRHYLYMHAEQNLFVVNHTYVSGYTRGFIVHMMVYKISSFLQARNELNNILQQM